MSTSIQWAHLIFEDASFVSLASQNILTSGFYSPDSQRQGCWVDA